MASFPEINGRQYSHASVEINVAGRVFMAVKELKYSDSLDPGELRGTNPMLLGTTTGEYKAEGSIAMAKRDAHELIAMLGPGFMQKRFDIVASYEEEELPLITDTVRGCRIKKNDGGSSAGSDPNLITFDLHVFYILWNGINPLEKMLVG